MGNKVATQKLATCGSDFGGGVTLVKPSSARSTVAPICATNPMMAAVEPAFEPSHPNPEDGLAVDLLARRQCCGKIGYFPWGQCSGQAAKGTGWNVVPGALLQEIRFRDMTDKHKRIQGQSICFDRTKMYTFR